MFLRWAIHATDSTFTGCTVNSAAASQAPGIFIRSSTRHSTTALDACKSTLTTW